MRRGMRERGGRRGGRKGRRKQQRRKDVWNKEKIKYYVTALF